VHFVGRLATYKYYNMDQVVAQALTIYKQIRTLPQEAGVTDFAEKKTMASDITLPPALETPGLALSKLESLGGNGNGKATS
jgi:UDP-galactopyranose mutase